MWLSLLASPALAATLTVGPSQPFSTIDSAIQAAAPGDTIAIEPGTYREFLDITKELVLEGTAHGVVVEQATWFQNVISVDADVTLRDLEIDGRGIGDYGLLGSSADRADIVLERVVIHDLRYHGVYSTGDLEIVDCEVYATGLASTSSLPGVYAGAMALGGLHLETSWFHDNVGAGVRLDEGDVVMDSLFSDNEIGALVEAIPGVAPRLLRNEFLDNDVGVDVTANNNASVHRMAVLRGNVLQGGGECIRVDNEPSFYPTTYSPTQNTSVLVLAQNTIVDCDTGVSITSGVKLLMSNTALAYNDIGLSSVWGAWTGGPTEPEVRKDHNLWFDNGEDVFWVDSLIQVAGPALGASSIVGVDPLYTSVTDLTPQPGSPLIDAGDPNYLDDDGTVSDIGHHTAR